MARVLLRPADWPAGGLSGRDCLPPPPRCRCLPPPPPPRLAAQTTTRLRRGCAALHAPKALQRMAKAAGRAAVSCFGGAPHKLPGVEALVGATR